MTLLFFIISSLVSWMTLMDFQMFNQCYILRGTNTNRLCYVVHSMYWCRLPQSSGFILSLKCFSSDPDSYSKGGMENLLQFSHLPRAGRVLLTLLFFPLAPSSYRVLSFHIFFSAGQADLSAISWGAASTSVCEGVFLRRPVGRGVLLCTYHSAILFISTYWL